MASSQNVPTATNVSRLVYNRVGKAGSSTMIAVLKASAKRNHFKLRGLSDGAYSSSTEALVMELRSIEPGDAWVNHASTATRALNDPRFAWINVVRDPFDRAQSLYYYAVDANIRGDKAKTVNEQRGSYPNQVCNCQRLEFSDCVERLALTPSCNFSTAGRRSTQLDARGHGWADFGSRSGQMAYFCEKQPTRTCTLEAAMRNYDDYLFVGMLEELSLTLRILEVLLPSWFRGASSGHIPHSRSTSNVNNMTGTRHAGAISKTARALLKRLPLFADELKFYEFCRRKFWVAVVRLLGDTSGEV